MENKPLSVCIERKQSLTCHWGHIGHRGRALSHVLVPKLFLVDGQQVRDPVIQPNAEDELTGKQKEHKVRITH